MRGREMVGWLGGRDYGGEIRKVYLFALQWMENERWELGLCT